MTDGQTDSSYHRRAILLIGGAFLFRLLYSLFYPVHLAGDEAYYWDWGRRPALGYYSKPPLIAWLYGSIDWIASGSLFAIRFTAIFLGTLSLIFSYLLTRKLFDTRTAFLAVLIGLAVPGNCLLNFVLTIDAPMMLAWSVALYFFWKYTRGENPVSSLIVVFVALGLGHLSKQMMLMFPPLAFAFLATGKETRPLLKRPGPWLALGGSLVFLIPPYLIWNSQNGWITFTHMKGHVGAENEASLLEALFGRAADFLEFVGTQLGALSPITAVLLFMLAVLPLFSRKTLTPEVRFLITFCGPLLLLFLGLAAFQKVQPNWPAPLYISGVSLVAAWFTNHIKWYPESDKSRSSLLRTSLWIGFTLCAVFYFLPIALQVTGYEQHKSNPNRRMIGSGRLGLAVQEVRETIPGWENHFVIASGHRYLTAWLAFELPDQPRVYRVGDDTIHSQYELWPEPWADGRAGQNAIFVNPGQETTPPRFLSEGFAEVRPIDTVEVLFGSGPREYTVFQCLNLTGPVRKLTRDHD